MAHCGRNIREGGEKTCGVGGAVAPARGVEAAVKPGTCVTLGVSETKEDEEDDMLLSE